MKSVWEGSDSELLKIMIPFYAPQAENILDVTANRRRIWKGLPYQPLCVDIDPQFEPDIVGDFANLPEIQDSSVDLVVFDPPHLPHRSTTNKEFNDAYGLKVLGFWKDGPLQFDPFFKEAARYLRAKGVVMANTCDFVNGRKYHWQHVELILSGEKSGFTACDMVVKVRKNAMQSGTWKRAHHARKHHSYWIVFRKGRACQ